MKEIPSKQTRAEWRRLAADTMMTSALGEYTPQEFMTLLDAVDELERRNAALVGALKMASILIRGNYGALKHPNPNDIEEAICVISAALSLAKENR